MIQVCTYHSAIFVKPQQWPTPSESIAIYCVRKLVSYVTHLQSCAKDDIWKKKEKQKERQGMTYELLLKIFSMKKLNSLLYRNCSVNFFTVPPELTRVGMLDFFRCTLRSVANHVIVWDRNHAKRGEYVLQVRSSEWPLRSVFVEQCCSCV